MVRVSLSLSALKQPFFQAPFETYTTTVLVLFPYNYLLYPSLSYSTGIILIMSICYIIPTSPIDIL